MSNDCNAKGPVEYPRWIDRRCTCHSFEEWEGNDWENYHPGPGGKNNPPRKSIFTPGHKKSRGPRKSKASNDMASLFKAEADAMLSVSGKDGKRQKISQAQLLMKQHWQRALKGDAKLGFGLIELGLKLFPPSEPEGEEHQLSDAERAAVESLLAWKNLVIDSEGDS